MSGESGGVDKECTETHQRPERDQSRSRRVRALLCTAPLHDLQGSRAQRGGIFERLDCYDLALGAIDFVVDRMGFDTGADPEDLLAYLRAEVARWVPDAGDEAVQDAAHVLNESLIRPRRGVYTQADDLTRRPFDFALLREEPALDGIRVIATNEAINVLVGALDFDVASAQSAADAKLASLISRRRFGEAREVAREARIRSIQYTTEVRRIIADTRLDVRRAGWAESVPARLDEILEHLRAQMDAETRMLEAMRANRDDAERPDLATHAQELVAVVEDCLNRHRELHNRVLEATDVFFAEHARQAFVAETSLRAVDLHDELLVPLLRGTLATAGPLVERFASAAWGPDDLRVASMDRLFDVLLADPRVVEGFAGELPDNELGRPEDPRRFPPSAWDEAETLLGRLDSPQRLSLILAGLGATPDAELVALLALQAADPPLDDLRRARRVLAAADEWAHRLRLTQDEFEVLTAVQAFLRDGGDDIILPHRERSLRLLGHEKRLDRLVSGRLFDPGRLSLSVLGCTWAPPPIAWRPAGGTGPVVVSENAAGFHSALAAFAGRASAVAYGAGTPFSQTAAGLAAIPSINRVVYFGDIDAEGLAIPRRAAAAAEAADVPIPVPATGLWSALADTATQFGEKVEPIPTEVAVELAAWIDEPDLQNRIRSLLEAGIRVPQEALRAEELAACPDPW